MKQVECLLGGKGLQYTWIDVWLGSERATLLWSFESLLWRISSGFPLASHLALPGSEAILGISRGPSNVYMGIS